MFFQRFQDYFPILRKACFLYHFRAALKRVTFNVTLWRWRILSFKSIPSCFWTYGEITPLFIKWMTSQVYNNNGALLFPLQIWKKPHWIKCPDQFRVNKRGSDCFEHIYEKDTKPSVNVKMPRRFFMVFTEGWREWRNSDWMGQECHCSCDCVSFPLILVEKSVVKLQSSEAAFHNWYEK